MPKQVTPVYADLEIIHAKNYAEFMLAIKNRGIPLEVNFDHDLGLDCYPRNGLDCAKHMVHYMMENNLKFPKDFIYDSHSWNPVGQKNILAFMKNAVGEIGYES